MFGFGVGVSILVSAFNNKSNADGDYHNRPKNFPTEPMDRQRRVEQGNDPDGNYDDGDNVSPVFDKVLRLRIGRFDSLPFGCLVRHQQSQHDIDEYAGSICERERYKNYPND